MSDHIGSQTVEDLSIVDPGDKCARGVAVIASPDERCRGRVLAIAGSLSIGRASADLVIDDEKISRLHVSIHRQADGRVFEIRDHDSRNGTRVDGVLIDGPVFAEEAVVRVGHTILALGPLPAPTLITAGPLVGRSAAFQQLVAHARAVAGAAIPVLLLGETGTGKELGAWAGWSWSCTTVKAGRRRASSRP